MFQVPENHLPTTTTNTPVFTHQKNVVTSLSVGRSKFSYIQRLVYCWGSKSCWSDYLFFWRISFLVWALLKDVENPRNWTLLWVIFISDWWSVPFCCDPSGISFVVVWRQIFPGEQKKTSIAIEEQHENSLVSCHPIHYTLRSWQWSERAPFLAHTNEKILACETNFFYLFF